MTKAGRVSRWLQLKPGEAATVGLMFAWYFCAIGAAFVARAVRDSLFLAHLSAERLPPMYVAAPLAVTVVGLIYARIDGKVRRDQLAIVTALAGAGLMIAARLLLGTGTWIFYALYVAASVLGGLVIMQLWTIAGDRFTTRDAKRVFGLIGAGGTAADIVVGLVIALLAPALGAENLLYVAAGLFLGIAVFALWLRRRAGTPPARPKPRPGKLETRVPGTSHLGLVGIALVCSVVVVTLVEFQFKAVTAASFGEDRAGMVRYFGVMSIATGTVSFVIQIIATRWLLGRLGVAGALLVLPVALGAGELGLLLVPGLIAATVLKAGDETFRFTVNDAASQLVFLPVPSRVRGRWKAVVESAWKPTAQLGLGLVLVGYRALTAGSIAPLVGVALAMIAVWLVVIARLRRAYVKALGETLRQRPPELDGAPIPAEEVTALRAALGGDDPAELLAALELARPLAAGLADAIAPLCDHADLQVRVVACEALGATSAFAPLRTRLGDPEHDVRDAAIAGLLGRDPKAAHALGELVRSAEARDRLRAAEILAAAGDRADHGVLSVLVADPDLAVERAALVAVAAVGGTETPVAAGTTTIERRAMVTSIRAPLFEALLDRATGKAPPELAPALAAVARGREPELAAALADASRGPARRELVRALGLAGTPAALAALIARLDAELDEALRTAIARALARALRVDPAIAIDRARIRAALDGELAAAYRAMAAAEELGHVETLARSDGTREAPPFLPDAPEGAAALLSTTLRDRQERHGERAFALLETLFPLAGFATVHANLRETDPVRRANAVEVLDGVLDRELRRRFVPLVDDSPRYAKLRAVGELYDLPAQDVKGWLRELLADPASWTVACAAYYAGVHRIASVRGRLVELAGHADPTVRETADLALGYLA